MCAEVRAVAGCLFEIVFPAEPDRRWIGVEPEASVTPLAERVEQGQRHFRFRAESPGEVRLRFDAGDADADHVTVRVAPERLD